jgi:dCTP deaminase
MILSGNEILNQMGLGQIDIMPFDSKQINPVSYNLRLGNMLRVYTEDVLDSRGHNPTRLITIPESGYVLQAWQPYLATTMERTRTVGFAPKLDGRSSTGRLFLFVHVSAGFGDPGFGDPCPSEWTLELVPCISVRVYPGMEICQIAYQEIRGEITPYNGRYQGQTGPTESRMHEGER